MRLSSSEIGQIIRAAKADQVKSEMAKTILYSLNKPVPSFVFDKRR
ncbi:hypothetical protein ACFQPF_14725 [Fictibacillus iocasae]|uniref:Uncharacterized protein n=1 Tax=Fictibacillus iocasae TaxID=2715437 RepID=A0ABW2NV96_9BACL